MLRVFIQLNVTMKKFYSVAQDTDQFFGSSGSFWRLSTVTPGDMLEVNPPFVEEILDAMASRINRIFQEHADDELCAAILIPDWGNYTCFSILSASKFTRLKSLLRSGKHCWVAGAQHRMSAEGSAFFSKGSTWLFVMQTDRSFLKKPVGVTEIEGLTYH